jgi:hypothetical protein
MTRKLLARLRFLARFTLSASRLSPFLLPGGGWEAFLVQRNISAYRRSSERQPPEMRAAIGLPMSGPDNEDPPEDDEAEAARLKRRA